MAELDGRIRVSMPGSAAAVFTCTGLKKHVQLMLRVEGPSWDWPCCSSWQMLRLYSAALLMQRMATTSLPWSHSRCADTDMRHHTNSSVHTLCKQCTPAWVGQDTARVCMPRQQHQHSPT